MSKPHKHDDSDRIRVVKTMRTPAIDAPTSNITTNQSIDKEAPIVLKSGLKVKRSPLEVANTVAAPVMNPATAKPRQKQRVTVGEEAIQPPIAVSEEAKPRTKSRRSSAKKEEVVESLSQMISRRLISQKYECMICYDFIRSKEQTWSCTKCFSVLHLKCIKNWVSHSITPQVDSWRCPGCQHPHQTTPTAYKCFCAKTTNPKLLHKITPHACDSLCMKERECSHFCAETCHPGPCAPCQENAEAVKCFCGKKSYAVLCANKKDEGKGCGGVCGKELGCGIHKCKVECHAGECAACVVTNESRCQCTKSSKVFDCGTKIDAFLCDVPCEFLFSCGVHECKELCHVFSAHNQLCPEDPLLVTHCFCGKSTLESIGCTRNSCTDPITSCAMSCEKIMACGHSCNLKCHSGPCDQCTELLQIPCACESTLHSLPCLSMPELPKAPTCAKLCTEKLCKRHKCFTPCCTLPSTLHSCSQVCSKTLKCTIHKCTYVCGHVGPCHRCHEGVQFEDLECSCGLTRIMGPVACGTKQPACKFPCLKARACGHDTGRHECHPDDESCPPCMKFVNRRCECNKSLFGNIPCSRTIVPKCELACGKVIDSCGHTCSKFCHSGVCIDAGKVCSQRCGYVRPSCLHSCTQQCHNSETCTETEPCTTLIRIKCACSSLSKTTQCKRSSSNPDHIETLECQPSCLIAQRNKRMAEALEIDTLLTPFNQAEKIEYSESLVKFARLNWMYFHTAEHTLKDFIKSPQQTFYFPTAKPRFNSHLARYVEHYGLTSQVVDEDRKMKGSVIVRKQLDTPARTPVKLLTEVAHAYTPEMFAQVDTIEKLAKYHGVAVNCILIEGFKLEMTADDLTCLITPLFGVDTVISLKQIDKSDESVEPTIDYILTVASVASIKIDIAHTEQLLASVLLKMKSTFVEENEWAGDVRVCWVSKNGEVLNECLEVGLVEKPVVLVVLAEAEPATTSNSFDALGSNSGEHILEELGEEVNY